MKKEQIQSLSDVCPAEDVFSGEFQDVGDEIWTVDVNTETNIAYTYWWRDMDDYSPACPGMTALCAEELE